MADNSTKIFQKHARNSTSGEFSGKRRSLPHDQNSWARRSRGLGPARTVG